MLNEFSSLPVEAFVGEQAIALSRRWRAAMEGVALSIFDDIAPMQDALSSDVKRVVEGRRFLVLMLLGYGRRGVELFKNLQIPVPETKAKRLHGTRDRPSATMGPSSPPVVG